MKKGFTQILILGLVAAVFLLGGTYFWKRMQKPPIQLTPSNIPKPSASPSVTPTPTSESTSSVDTSNWKTYTNETYKYSLKYPDSYEVKGWGDNVCLEKKSDGNCAASILSYAYGPMPTKFPDDNGSADQEIKQLNRNGIVGITGQYISNGIKSGPVAHIKNPFGGYIYLNADKPLFDQILSTFKFTN